MELELDKIRNNSDPYQSFLDSIKSKQTGRKYKNALNSFLKLVPTKIYEEELDKKPQDRDPKTLARYFIELTKKNSDLVTQVIIQFVKHIETRKKKGVSKQRDELTNKIIKIQDEYQKLFHDLKTHLDELKSKVK